MAGRGVSPQKMQKMMLIFVIALVCFALVVKGSQYGLFFDGLLYGAISRNMSLDLGSFWSPYYSDSTYGEFFEHPPLGFFLQSGLFRVIGDGFWVETVWALLFVFLCAGLFALLWREFRSHSETALPGVWWALLLWFSFPSLLWTFSNNMLEVSFSFFVLLGVWFVWRALVAEGLAVKVLWAVLGGLATVCTLLIKGPPGLFLWATPGLLWFLYPTFRSRCNLWVTGIVISATLVALGLVYGLNPSAEVYADAYFSKQVVASLAGKRNSTADRFHVVWDILASLAQIATIVGVLAVLPAWLGKRKTGRAFAGILCNRRLGFAVMSLGLAGTLPFVLSPKQATHYWVPPGAFLALGAALVFAQPMRWVDERLARWRWAPAVLGLLLIAVAAGSGFYGVSHYRTPRKYKEIYRDVSALLPQSHEGSGALMAVCPDRLGRHWALGGVLQRYHRVSIFGDQSIPLVLRYDYYLRERSATCPVPKGCIRKASARNAVYEVYSCR